MAGCCKQILVSTVLVVELSAIFFIYFIYSLSRVEKEQPRQHAESPSVTSKHFAYYLLTESCLPPHLAFDHALGNITRCDVYVLSFQYRCEVTLPPNSNIKYYFHPDTTWSTGRNLLYKYGLQTKINYQYHTFIDDDIQLFYTKSLDDYANKYGLEQFDRKTEFMESFLNSEQGLPKAVSTWTKSPWRELEDTLLARSPAFAQVNLCETNGNQIRTFQSEKWRMVCPTESKMPDITPVFFIDTLLISYHRDAAPLLMPYSTVLDEVSWFISAMYQMFRAKALLYRQGIAIWTLSVSNPMHRAYPRGAPPKNYLELYFATDGKDIKDLLDPRQTDFVVFYDYGKWKTVFFADKGVCTNAVKFPVEDHYKLI